MSWAGASVFSNRNDGQNHHDGQYPARELFTGHWRQDFADLVGYFWYEKDNVRIKGLLGIRKTTWGELETNWDNLEFRIVWVAGRCDRE